MTTEVNFFELDDTESKSESKSDSKSDSGDIDTEKTDNDETNPGVRSGNAEAHAQADEIIQIDSFDDMGLKEPLLRGIYGYGFDKPSAIQARAIPQILKRKDIIVQSQSGTGKTGTFIISTVQIMDDSLNGCQGIILVHTKELAFQIFEIFQRIAQYTKIKPVLCIGGEPIHKSIQDLKIGPVIVIGTPGRVLSLLRRRNIPTNRLRILVIDEADELLSDSFEDQVSDIVSGMPDYVQLCLFSATMPPKALAITEQFMLNPTRILIEKEELTLDGISQFYIDVERNDHKFETLCDIFNTIMINQSIIYVNSIGRANTLEQRLKKSNFPISMIHSGMELTERRKIMTEFKSGHSRILISTDLLSRGIDIQQISIVINYDIPNNKEAYLHRIGRSGRFGRKGVAINFRTNYDQRKFQEIEEHYGIKIESMPQNIQTYL